MTNQTQGFPKKPKTTTSAMLENHISPSFSEEYLMLKGYCLGSIQTSSGWWLGTRPFGRDKGFCKDVRWLLIGLTILKNRWRVLLKDFLERSEVDFGTCKWPRSQAKTLAVALRPTYASGRVPCCREASWRWICLNFGEKPFKTTLIVPWLSSFTRSVTGLFKKRSQRWSEGDTYQVMIARCYKVLDEPQKLPVVVPRPLLDGD